MPSPTFRELTQGISTALASLQTGTPDVKKRFGESGWAATATDAVLLHIRSPTYPVRVG